MSLAKESQSLSLEGIDIPMNHQPERMDKNELMGSLAPMIVMDDEPDLEVHEDGPESGIRLTLDHVPGGLNQEEIIEEPAEIEVDEPEDVEVNNDPWAWTTKNFVQWLSGMMQKVPVHSGRDTAGIERAISYLERLDREISKAVRTDLDNEITIDAVEKARDEIQRGIDRLEERHDKVKQTKYPKRNSKKKKAAEYDTNGVLVKEAGTTKIDGIVITVPIFISGLARVCINGMVSAGHDIEDMFEKLATEWKLTSREKFELVQLLADMNYPVRTDRGFPVGTEIDTTRSDNYDWAANYHA